MNKLKYYLSLILILFLIICIESTPIIFTGTSQSHSAAPEKWEIVNLDGDLSLIGVEDAAYWNHHNFRLSDKARWSVDFNEEVTMSLRTSSGDAGHIAAGMWWTKGFIQGEKIPISEVSIRVEFDILVEEFSYEGSNEWLRVGLACAVQRIGGEVVYTELDIIDSPNTKSHITGNIGIGGDIIYRGGDVVEYKIDEIPLNTWRHYSINLTDYIDEAWEIKDGDRLESVYIVIECEGKPVNVVLKLDNLWISKSTS